MTQALLIVEQFDAQRELAQFGFTLEVAQRVARAASAGRMSALDIDVAFTPGMLSHIYGHRQIRRELLPRGWRKGRQNNVESVVNDELGIQIVFQNVDLACDPAHAPQAISGKGAGARRLVQAGLQGELWGDPPTLPSHASSPAVNKIGVTPTVWIFCVSDDGRHLRAELSKPDLFEGDQFEEFSTRIFLMVEDIGNAVSDSIVTANFDDLVELDVPVHRKKNV